jgi:hypothetical protein
MRQVRPRAFGVLIIVCASCFGCTSPEATRSRGAGRGADVGNRRATVEMHEGSRPFWNTPDRIRREHPPLEPARQADELSRR